MTTCIICVLAVLLFSLVLWLAVRVHDLSIRVRRLTQYAAITEKRLLDEINKNSKI